MRLSDKSHGGLWYSLALKREPAGEFECVARRRTKAELLEWITRRPGVSAVAA
jgi:hypothetical protein